jgi:hypothetical protein
MRKPVLSLCPSLCPRADLKALSGGQDQLHRLTSLLAHRGGLHQGKAHWLDLPLQPLPPCIKRRAAYSVLLTETPLPSSHFAADGQSTRPSASFAPPPAPGCSCHHYAPVNSLRASGVHRMLTSQLYDSRITGCRSRCAAYMALDFPKCAAAGLRGMPESPGTQLSSRIDGRTEVPGRPVATRFQRVVWILPKGYFYCGFSFWLTASPPVTPSTW